MNYREELIAYRRGRAREAIEDARILFDGKRFYSARRVITAISLNSRRREFGNGLNWRKTLSRR
ncbi:MAG: hypothetical protein HZA01_16770 [Nitrospinae bacterium]|nr:hypothetical protein [Nitrospinota bacterium]